ncbi:MAG TPA: sigma-70 family RNA polymerase sigma factor [Jatrophihabitans sp.]|nr:sigma-70 family RNA polymerase sigma factor [Jatrophihabitans sp.]
MASLIRITDDWDLAEDCVQDAVERALVRWPGDGTPDNPAAWLTTTAHRRALDVLRRRRTEAGKLAELAERAERTAEPAAELDPYGSAYGDDRLRLLFTCCHPALPLAGRVALTLKTVGGLSVREIARAFLVSEATMGQRLLRARNKIAHARIRLVVPEPDRLADRTAAVLAVVYLIFNSGYGGGPEADRLAEESVRLARLVARLLPELDEAHGLLALLLFQHARRAARTDPAGMLVPMAEQDRNGWDSAMIAEGLASLATARGTGRPAGPYRLQAEIAALHATAPSADATDWAGVVAAYDHLLRLQPSPVIALNRAVALGYRDAPEAGLAALAEVADQLTDYHLVPAVRAGLLRLAGRDDEALAAYHQAIEAAGSPAERRLLQRRIDELTG